jgi:hypothetical protein
MLAPQFSLRRLLGWVTLSGFVSLIVASAARGKVGAMAILLALAGFVAMLVIYAVAYAAVKLAGGGLERISQRRRQTIAPPTPPP